MTKIKLRPLIKTDLDVYYELNKPSRKYHEFNGPYFDKQTKEELIQEIDELRSNIANSVTRESVFMIADNVTDELIGQVSWYWKSKETKWMEVGIVIFREDYWSKGIGFIALKMWIDKLFDERNDIVRLGLTTWSGNFGMIKLSEKLGLKLEAKYRKARIVAGEYYDSVSYGILREEWELLNK